MAAAANFGCSFSVQETINAPHPTTSTFRPNNARIEVLHQCRQLSNDIQFSQSNGYPLNPCVIQVPYPSLVVQLVVAVKDKKTGEIWACNASPEIHQIYITKDGMFRIVPEVEPYAWMLSNSVDCRNKPLPPYAGNLAFMLPVKDEKPSHHALRIKLCHGTTDHDCEVLDEVQFFVKSHNRGSKLYDFQSGRTITEVEKPLPKIQMQGVLAGEIGRTIRMHFQNLGDNGQYNRFLRDRETLAQRVNGEVRFQDLLSAVLLEEAIIYFGQNKMDDCLATCWDVCARAMRHNSGNWPFILTKAFYIISAVYRQAKDFEKANEYMEKSSECLEPASLSEETAVNRYNEAALLAEKSAAVGITPEEERKVERLFEEVQRIWTQQKDNESMRCVIRSFNRMITYFLKTSRTRFPDLGKDVSEVSVAKAGDAIQKVEKNLLAQCPKRLQATFLIGKADYYIRRAMKKGVNVLQQQRVTDFQTATDVLKEAMEISQQLKMQKEIDGIQDRMRMIEGLPAIGLQWLNERPPLDPAAHNERSPPDPVARNEPREGNTDDLEVLWQNLLLSEDEKNRRLPEQCTE